MSRSNAGRHAGSGSHAAGAVASTKGKLMKNARVPLVISGALASIAVCTVGATATVAPGTPGKDVTRGLDNDVVTNTFIQPPGVAAKQHMEATDVLFGRGNQDLLQGNQGSDTLVGGGGADILIGGPERGSVPNSDVLLGGTGPDINIWAPGDGSDAYVGETGRDTMVFAPFVTRPNGAIRTERFQGRRVPRVDISSQPAFSCTIVKVRPFRQLGAQFLVRFNLNGQPVVTVRQKDVERLVCPSPLPNRARVANLTRPNPTFRTVRLGTIGGDLGAILARP